ncbi:hypothetical protein [Methylomagnum sp.]
MQAQAELHATNPIQLAEPGLSIRLLVYGDFLPFSLDTEIEKMFPINIIGKHPIFADFERDALALKPDVLAAEFPALRSDSAARVRDLAQRAGAKWAVVVYGVTVKSVLERLNRPGQSRYAQKKLVSPLPLGRGRKRGTPNI